MFERAGRSIGADDPAPIGAAMARRICGHGLDWLSRIEKADPRNEKTSGDALAEAGTNEGLQADAEAQGFTTRRKELAEVAADSPFGNGPTSVMVSVHTAETADAGGVLGMTKFMS